MNSMVSVDPQGSSGMQYKFILREAGMQPWNRTLAGEATLRDLYEQFCSDNGMSKEEVTLGYCFGGAGTATEFDADPETLLAQFGFAQGKLNKLQLVSRPMSDMTGAATNSVDDVDDDWNDNGGAVGQKRRQAVSWSAASGSSNINAQVSNANATASTAVAPAGSGFVGLNNQGATCYLNSLIQSLFMTPEFRNALYRWTPPPKVAKAGEGETASSDTASGEGSEDEPEIPGALRDLFLQLQTSKLRAVSTTALTKSFGWSGADAFQQHDVQELMRVLFDALEAEWADTTQAHLIQDLFQGEMKDYVKCLKCNTESARVDKYMDIPLVIKPFGSTQIMTSIKQAMEKFVEVEKLDEDNLYACATCEEKTPALKGLKFVSFPYILALQLKRFDFDYTTFRRVKLNSRFTFPLELDLTPFAPEDKVADATGDGAAATERDAAEQQPPSRDSSRGSSTSEGGVPDADAVMDSSDDEAAVASPKYDSDFPPLAPEQRKRALKNNMLYELYSIMIHRGSALGGHYFAYIKSFEDGKWRCFNDSSVTFIAQSQLSEAFGGQTTYGSTFGSSTSGYMLLYRRVEPKRNELPLKPAELPASLLEQVAALEAEQAKEEAEALAAQRSMVFRVRTKPGGNQSDAEAVVSIDFEKTVSELKQEIMKQLELTGDESEYRLYHMGYDLRTITKILTEEDKTLYECGFSLRYSRFNIYVQHDPEKEFAKPDFGGTYVTLNVYIEATKTWEKDVRWRYNRADEFPGMRKAIAEHYNTTEECLIIARCNYYNSFFDVSTCPTFISGYVYENNTIFVAICNEPCDRTVALTDTEFGKAATQMVNSNTVTVHIQLEEKDKPREVVFHDVDCQQTLAKFKVDVLQPLVAPLKETEFQLFTERYKGYRTELMRLAAPMKDVIYDFATPIIIQKGAALRAGFFAVEIELLTLESDGAPTLFEDCPLSESMTVDQMKAAISDHIKLKKKDPAFKFQDLEEDPKKYRLWTGVYGRPTKLVATVTPTLYQNCTLILQTVEEPVEVDLQHRLYFYRVFQPDTLELSDLREIVLPANTVTAPTNDSIRGALEKILDIPFNDIATARSIGGFPYLASGLEARNLRWETRPLHPTVFSNSDCFYVKDTRIADKELTQEEEDALAEAAKKKAAAARKTNSSSYWGREVALKIKHKGNTQIASTGDEGDGESAAAPATETQDQAVGSDSPMDEGTSDVAAVPETQL
eukprot:m.27923 g.27923  ORF g.27923 m.27923 type:complete len:1216 (-) comp8999_c0_seq1:3944-7591(-)